MPSTLLICLTLFAAASGFSTTLPAGCKDGGRTYMPGQEYYTSDCRVCRCRLRGPSCYHYDCMPAMCYNARKEGSSCCYTCPTGRNCKTPSGEIISVHPGTYVTTAYGHRCTCPTDSPAFPYTRSPRDYTAICVPRTTLAPPRFGR